MLTAVSAHRCLVQWLLLIEPSPAPSFQGHIMRGGNVSLEGYMFQTETPNSASSLIMVGDG